MSIFPAAYEHFSELQRQANTSEELKVVCDLFSETVLFEHYLFAVCRVTSFSSPDISVVTNYPDKWIKSYFDEKYQANDPVVRYCFEHIAPIRWDRLREMDEYLSPEGERVFKKAAEFGLGNGISIPLKTHTGEICIFSLATANTKNIDQRFTDLLPVAQLFAMELFKNVSRINISQDTTDKEDLTPRELECISWACEGKTAWEISKIIDVSERTVVFHLTSATRKLGAINRQHAVAKAITAGLIKPSFLRTGANLK